uniref:Uncharacterized protein n=1 Tax=Candidatus Giovannonibacteria bacterium GW2011_GWF2_42_19 TaxID=1618659 RepID=A0A0G1BR29_9BACT|nr:MAG: hypothetical protein UV11_C0005G0005 [Candidatus Giovannonibacteria bacterium GW2011_GWF2_42_19]
MEASFPPAPALISRITFSITNYFLFFEDFLCSIFLADRDLAKLTLARNFSTLPALSINLPLPV